MFIIIRVFFKWMFKNNLPDQWLVAVEGHKRDEVFTLDQVRQFQENSPKSDIQIINVTHARDPKAKWLRYGAEDSSKSSAIGCGYVFAIFIPIIGFFFGLALLTNDKTRNDGLGVTICSVIFFFIWWVILAELGVVPQF